MTRSTRLPRSTAARHSSYGGYVQPVVALALGWLVLVGQVTPRTLEGVAVILLGVILIVWSDGRTQRATEAEPEPSVECEDLAA